MEFSNLIRETFSVLESESIKLLPALDPNVGIPWEKRTSLLKSWKPIECERLRKIQLESFIDTFCSASNANPDILPQIINRFLSDFITANEQLINLGCRDSQQVYEKFIMEKVPMHILFREFLALLGIFNLANEQRQAPPWFKKAISIRLSHLLAQKESLSSLFIAFDDLGGSSFWENSAALHAVATLLSKKPAQTKTHVYHRTMLKQFMELLKLPKWSEKIGHLFALVIESVLPKALNDVQFQVIDKLCSPWEICLDRVKSNPFSNEYAFWNSYLDDSLWTLKSWFRVLHSQSEIPCIDRFEKLCPFLMFLCGQASLFKELEEFSKDLALVIQNIVKRISSDTNIGETLLRMILTVEKEHKWHDFFKVELYKKNLISEVNEREIVRKYNVRLQITRERLNEQQMLEYKIHALNIVLNQLDKEDSSALLVSLIHACVSRWKPSENDVIQLNLKNEDEYRPLIEELGEKLADHETNILSVLYVLSSLSEQFIDLNMEFSESILIKLLEFAEIIFSSLLTKLRPLSSMDIFVESDFEVDVKSAELALGLISGILLLANDSITINEHLKLVNIRLQEFMKFMENASDKMAQMLFSVSESCQQLKFLFNDLSIATENPVKDVRKHEYVTLRHSNTIPSNISTWINDLESSEESIRGHALIDIARELRKRNFNIFKTDADFEIIYEKILVQIHHPDTYVYLASINAIAELAYWKTEPFLDRLIQLFMEFEADEQDIQLSLMVRTKIGEAVAKVCKQLGDFSPLYFDRLASTFLKLVKESDELIRASALSSLADLIFACRGRRFDKIIYELLLCISQVVATDKSPLVRRAAVHLLRAMLASAHDILFEIFMDTLRDINRQLRRLWEFDQDDVVRLQAELALIEIKEAIKSSIEKA